MNDTTPDRWWKVPKACAYLGIGRRQLYHEINSGRLRAARIGSRGSIRTCQEWCDDYMVKMATPVPITTSRRGAA